MREWQPSIDDGSSPRYAAIVRSLQEAVAAGELVPGDRLPPQRELASELDVSLGTVTRAYNEARERGLVEATVGRGTFVRAAPAEVRRGLGALVDRELIDLSLLVAPVLEEERWPDRLRQAAARLADRPDLNDLLGYQRHEGLFRHRRAASAWLARTGMEAAPDEVLIAGSAQHAAVAALSVLTRPGDVVLAEELTNPGLRDAAAWLHLRLHGLPMDEDGLVPDAFAAACRTGVGRTLYTMPTYHNPTTRTMPERRRTEIARIAEEHGVAVVEDGVHALLAEEAPPPLSARLPDLGYFLTSHSKTLSPSLRVGYLRAPPAAHEELAFALRATLWMVSPLLAEVASDWIEEGVAQGLLEEKRTEARDRQQVARDALDGFRVEAGRASHHLWLRLPEGWRSEAFVSEARRRGVAVTSPRALVAGQVKAPRAVRLCLGAARSREELQKGLELIRELLEEGPASSSGAATEGRGRKRTERGPL